MPDTLLLHIGYPKSGTTTLQESLFLNAPGIFFMGKANGPYCPPEIDALRALINYGTYHHVTTRAASVIGTIREVWQKDGRETALISLEGLTNPFVDTHYSQPKDTFRKLNDIARVLAPLQDSGVKVRIFVTLRDQTALLPSLFSQVYLQGFASGLYGPSYASFLDALLQDDILGYGPEFCFDAVLDHLGSLFGAENVFASVMNGLLSGSPCRDTAAAAAFMGLGEDACIALIGTTRSNVRKGALGRRMMTESGGVERFERNTGISLRAKAFPLSDRLRLWRHKRVYWHLSDEEDRIRAYFAASNARLKSTHGISF